jgi:hypothetical protein
VRLGNFGLFLGVLLAALAPARAEASTEGCKLTSEVRAGVEGRLVATGKAFGAGVTYIATRELDGSIVALVSDGNAYVEVGLYWPTPADPVYAYRRMHRLPRDSTLLGDDADQSIIVLREPTEFVVGGELATYKPINYGGFTLSIDGCGGDDTLEGGNGADHLFDYAGQNRFFGHGGRDWLEGTGPLFSGGSGDDCVTGDGDGHLAQILGDDGDDTLESTGRFGVTLGGTGSDTCSAGTVDECESLAPAMCLGWN